MNLAVGKEYNVNVNGTVMRLVLLAVDVDMVTVRPANGQDKDAFRMPLDKFKASLVP